MKIASVVLSSLICLLTACNQQTAATDKLDENSVRIGIMALNWPKIAAINSDIVVNAKIFNAGTVTIPALGKNGDLLKVGVTYHWRTMDEKIYIWDGVITSLKSDLKVGEEQNVDILVRSPTSIGKYILEIDMVQNSAFWFAGIGSQTARMNIDIK